MQHKINKIIRNMTWSQKQNRVAQCTVLNCNWNGPFQTDQFKVSSKSRLRETTRLVCRFHWLPSKTRPVYDAHRNSSSRGGLKRLLEREESIGVHGRWITICFDEVFSFKSWTFSSLTSSSLRRIIFHIKFYIQLYSIYDQSILRKMGYRLV